MEPVRQSSINYARPSPVEPSSAALIISIACTVAAISVNAICFTGFLPDEFVNNSLVAAVVLPSVGFIFGIIDRYDAEDNHRRVWPANVCTVLSLLSGVTIIATVVYAICTID